MAPLPPVLAQRFVAALGTGGKRERTRAQLVHAAAHVFADRGWSQATMAQVAEAAGVTTGTVYNHFASKEEIAEALSLALAAAVNQAIVASIEPVKDAAQRMAIGQRRFVWLAAESPSWACLLLEMAAIAPRHVREVEQDALRDLRLGVRQKRFKVPSEESAMEVVTGVVQAAMRRVAAGAAPPRHDVACAALVLRALGMDPAEAMEIARRPLPDLPPFTG
ncbi:TetR/AcrR family transcriptional regulator [Ramlibacter algicola]|uniref:TetR/AcrR family transcriptional regulator n=1 Tax=Ramlibacter algicola TaxID=2795217 RepID=A0A934Q306_9BURK|nr:TetR/AcrR family transcriptional regulator [Ramlibacter algicola]MBK0394213.1 TetR/AcrR family transcriptional regulator [Ramlibacter algicola]